MTGNALRLIARESIGSWFEQSLVARRQEHFRLRAEISIEFAPHNYQQAAGLVHYYNRHKFHFAGITWHEKLGRCLTILSCPGDWPESQLSFPLDQPLDIPADGTVEFAAEIDHAQLQFYFRIKEDTDWQTLGPVLDASLISDEAGRGEHASFTGAFIGMAAFDTSGNAIEADFDRFDYIPSD